MRRQLFLPWQKNRVVSYRKSTSFRYSSVYVWGNSSFTALRADVLSFPMTTSISSWWMASKLSHDMRALSPQNTSYNQEIQISPVPISGSAIPVMIPSEYPQIGYLNLKHVVTQCTFQFFCIFISFFLWADITENGICKIIFFLVMFQVGRYDCKHLKPLLF